MLIVAWTWKKGWIAILCVAIDTQGICHCVLAEGSLWCNTKLQRHVEKKSHSITCLECLAMPLCKHEMKIWKGVIGYECWRCGMSWEEAHSDAMHCR